ncbi:MAG TPA: 23S rRNA (adenine(2503)-C(2))-methyltransferase RlmN [Patescibacteria group bacterium]|nr:23S rRNA (adenine(2503)-C(2))-methyltransferase RlmN [Patescibacteria group bacterium]
MSRLEEILRDQPKYRQKQIEAAWFDPTIKSYAEITTLPQELRDQLADLPWLSGRRKLLQESKIDKTWRALLELSDGELVETVLMGRNDRFTVCISSQVGCAMNCVFCATGQSGFKRNLSAEEIIDQARFWHYFLQEKFNAKISNIVMMGQGEPFLNYDNARAALQVILANTDIGPTKITVSTVGVPAVMERLLEDAYFPPVRLAVSLHSAIDETRKKLIPSHQPDFFVFLENWAKKYHQRFNSRSHFIGFEYIMLAGINDDEKHYKALVKLLSKMGRARINLIPYNPSGQSPFQGTAEEKIKDWHDRLLDTGFICTTRRSQGQDIFAACGQLRNSI